MVLLGEDLADLGRMYRLADLSPGDSDQVVPVDGIWVGSMRLVVGTWFMCRPDEGAGLLYFGKTIGVFTHTDGDGVERVWVKAAWYHTYQEEQGRGREPLRRHYDREMRCPLLSDEEYQHGDGPWFMAQGIVPWPCVVLKHPTKHDAMVALARHWHILRNFSGIPVPEWLA